MVHYQSRAQVPAPCVGKARRPPVLQVSTTQTPREGSRCGGDKGGVFSRRCHSPCFSLFLRCCESRQPRVQTQVVGVGRERSGAGGWGWVGVVGGQAVRGVPGNDSIFMDFI